MGKKRVIFGSVALVCAGTYVSAIRNPALYVVLQKSIPSIETPDSRALDGAWYTRKSPDADGMTRYNYRYADAEEAKSCWPTKDVTCAPADKDLKKALEQAMQEVSGIGNIQFRQAGHNEKTDFKVYGIEDSTNPALGGLAAHRVRSLVEGNLLLLNHVVDLRPKDKKTISCTLDNKNNQTCTTREQTPDEVQAQVKVYKQLQEWHTRHELMHMLGAKHSFHTDIVNFGIRKLPPEMEDYKNTVMSYSSRSGISNGQKITLGKLDREYLERHHGAPKKPMLPKR